MMEGSALPAGVMEMVCPDGLLSDGKTRIGFDCPNDPTKVFWVHNNCFSCSVCNAQLSDERVALDGFSMRFDPPRQTAWFLCCSSPGSNNGCDKKYEKYAAAQGRLQCIREMTLEDMRALLQERNVPISNAEENDKALLVRKIVVTENQGKKRDTLKNTLTTFHHGKEKDSHVVKARSQPGAEFLDSSCLHGAQWKLKDTPMQSMKRQLVVDFFQLAGNFTLEYLYSNNNHTTGSGVVISPLEASIATAATFFTETPERFKLLQSDMEERFVPKQLWSAAINGACEEEEGEDYICLTLCGAVIAHAILDALEAKQPPDLLNHTELFELFGPPSAPLKTLLNDITSSPAKMYHFLDSSTKFRSCDCMQYVAAAAEMDALRHKPMRVKASKYRCACCKQVLVEPKLCSLCNEVAYCDQFCQKPHWKVHRKECTGRKTKQTGSKENSGSS